MTAGLSFWLLTCRKSGEMEVKKTYFYETHFKLDHFGSISISFPTSTFSLGFIFSSHFSCRLNNVWTFTSPLIVIGGLFHALFPRRLDPGVGSLLGFLSCHLPGSPCMNGALILQKVDRRLIAGPNIEFACTRICCDSIIFHILHIFFYVGWWSSPLLMC